MDNTRKEIAAILDSETIYKISKFLWYIIFPTSKLYLISRRIGTNIRNITFEWLKLQDSKRICGFKNFFTLTSLRIYSNDFLKVVAFYRCQLVLLSYLHEMKFITITISVILMNSFYWCCLTSGLELLNDILKN